MYYPCDLAGHVISELNSSGGWNRGEIYAGGRHVATYVSSTTYFDHGDWLGTERARSDVNGAISETCQGLPFGDGLSCSGSDVSPLHFTGKQRDSETGLDYPAEASGTFGFGARYDSSSVGRFMTPDWSAKVEPVPYAKLGDPQSLNLYVYVMDNPVTDLDAFGHCTDPTGCITPPPPKHPKLANRQGGCRCGTNHHFKTTNQAATAALKGIFPTAEKQHVEYGGRIYKNANGTYSYTTPVTQHNPTAVDVDAGGREGSRIPPGTSNAGIYHTHENPAPRMPAQEGFSAPDAQMAVREHVPSYIETPSGLIHEIVGTHATSYLTAPQYTWRVNGLIP